MLDSGRGGHGGKRRTEGAMIGREDSSEAGILAVVRACVRTFRTGFVDGERGLMTLSDLKRRSKAKPVESNLGPGVEIRWLRSQWRKPCQIVTRRLSLVACRLPGSPSALLLGQSWCNE